MLVLSLRRKAVSQAVRLHSRDRLTYVMQSFGGRPKIVWRSPTDLSTNAERLASLDAQANELGGSWQKDEESLANRNTPLRDSANS